MRLREKKNYIVYYHYSFIFYYIKILDQIKKYISSTVFLINAIITLIVIIQLIFPIHYSDFYLNLLKIELLVILICFIVINKFYLKLKWNHSLFIHVGALILFNYSRIFLDVFGLKNMQVNDRIYPYFLSNETTGISILIYIAALVFLHNGAYLFNSKHKKKNEIKLLTLPGFQLIVFGIFFISLFGASYKYWNDLKTILSVGYLSLYTGMATHGGFARILWVIFKSSFPLLIASLPGKRNFILFSSLLLMVTLLDLLKGHRGVIILPIVFIIWYYFSFYSNKKFNIKKILLFLSITFMISVIMLNVRSNNKLNQKTFGQYVFHFFDSQGSSMNFLPNYIDFQEKITNPTRLYVLSPIMDAFGRFLKPEIYRKGHSEELVEITYSLDHKLMYAMAPDLYLKGAGYGSNYLTEFYALAGVPGVLVLSFILGYFIMFFEKLVRQNRVALLLSYFWITTLVWSPRSSIIPNILFPIISIILYFVIFNLSKNVKFTFNKKAIDQE